MLSSKNVYIYGIRSEIEHGNHTFGSKQGKVFTSYFSSSVCVLPAPYSRQ